jgi:hypothetical protein
MIPPCGVKWRIEFPLYCLKLAKKHLLYSQKDFKREEGMEEVYIALCGVK